MLSTNFLMNTPNKEVTTIDLLPRLTFCREVTGSAVWYSLTLAFLIFQLEIELERS